MTTLCFIFKELNKDFMSKLIYCEELFDVLSSGKTSFVENY